MILLDTHVWVWLVNESDRLTERHKEIINNYRNDGLGVSVISCWEVAKLVDYGRLELTYGLSSGSKRLSPFLESASSI